MPQMQWSERFDKRGAMYMAGRSQELNANIFKSRVGNEKLTSTTLWVPGKSFRHLKGETTTTLEDAMEFVESSSTEELLRQSVEAR